MLIVKTVGLYPGIETFKYGTSLEGLLARYQVTILAKSQDGRGFIAKALPKVFDEIESEFGSQVVLFKGTEGKSLYNF